MTEITEENRIVLVTSCSYSSEIPKVKDAGVVMDNYQISYNGIKVIRDGYQGTWMTEIVIRLRGHH